MIKYVSDLHLGHSKILESRTQFQTVEEMDAYLIEQWNMHVDKDDEVWILGDLSFRAKGNVEDYLKQLAGKKHLLIGNHDTTWMKKVDLSKYFETVSHMEVIRDGKRRITLCHYPMMEWSGSRYSVYSLEEGVSWLIHGHLHDSRNSKAYQEIVRNIPCALNCGVDLNGYHPVSFEELFENNAKFYGKNLL